MTVRAFRWAAIGIALLAVADPSIRASRVERPLVAVVATDAGASESAEAVARALERAADVVRAPLANAAATVLVGVRLPDEPIRAPGPVFAVRPAIAAARIAAISMPTVVPRDARVPVDVEIELPRVAGRPPDTRPRDLGAARRVEVALRTGDLVADRQRVDLPAASTSASARLTFAPGTTGVVPVRVTAGVAHPASAASATTVVTVTDRRWPVLVFDPRPSWHSTFVRRALVEDPRLTVSHRQVTSRGVSNTFGDAPATLENARALSAYRAIVVGTPEALTGGDVAGLETYLRHGGGRVVLLIDRAVSGPIDRLTGVRQWRMRRLAAPVRVDVDSTTLLAREVVWPSVMPAGVTVQRSLPVDRDSTLAPLLWSVPVGAGRVFVSGASDAWQYRDAAASGFAAWWRTAVVGLAASAPPPLDVSVRPSLLRPGGWADVRVTVREDVLAGSGGGRSARVVVRLVTGGDTAFVRVWPDRSPGQFSGSLVAPGRPGPATVVVDAEGNRAEVSVVIDSLAAPPAPAEPALLDAVTSARSGAVLGDDQVDRLAARLVSALQPTSRVETWYPMRTAWWIVPFALALGAEWWSRRRRGLR